MDTEQALQIAQELLSAKSKPFGPVYKAIFQQAWDGKKLKDIQVSGYSDGHIQRIAAQELWDLLSEVTGEPVGIKNLKVVLEGWKQQQYRRHNCQPNNFKQPPPNDLPTTNPDNKNINSGVDKKAFTTPRQDWDTAPASDVFYGRTNEIQQIEKWLLKDHCKLLAIWGMGGIGKTALAVRIAQQIQPDFQYVIWRSLRHAPPLPELLTDLISFISDNRETNNFLSIAGGVSALIKYLKTSRCLVLLDTWEAVLDPGKPAGFYQKEYQDYGYLLEQVAASPHNSCLVLTSWEKPREVASQENPSSLVHSLQLKGLGEAAREILREKHLPEEERWEELIKPYRGNPFALKAVASMIQEVFAGNVSEFLKKNTMFLGDLEYILYKQFNRLSNLEQEIMYFLAKASQPVCFDTLRDEVKNQLSQSELIKLIESLMRRSLIEILHRENEIFYSLQPVVKRYIINEYSRR